MSEEKVKETVGYWLDEIKRSRYTRWEERVKKIIRRYRDESESGKLAEKRFNILWSNIETLKPIIYSRVPHVEIITRWKNRDPLARLGAEVLERATEYELDSQSFDYSARCCRDDYLMVGRGVLWERFVPEFDESGMLASIQTISDYVAWSDFGHSPARTWDEVSYVWRRVLLTEAEARAAFGDKIAANLKYIFLPEGLKETAREADKISKYGRAEVYEIWDKETRRVYHISSSFSKPCKVSDDPLGLRDFFPCARPMYASTTTDTLEPMPDFLVYQDLAAQLDSVTHRITVLTDALRAIGVYDTTAEGIERLLQGSSDALLVGIKNFAALVQAGGVEGVISWFPVDKIAGAIRALIEIQNETKKWIFEITGMSDIIRGQSDARETARAQQIKSSFATIRISDRQQEFQRFLRDQIAIKAEIIAEKYPVNILANMVGIDIAQNPMFPQAVKMLQQDLTRCYKIDIETDSTLAVDEQMQKAQLIEFLAAFGQSMNQFATAAQTMPDWMPVFGQVLLMNLRAYKVGRQVEDLVEQTLDDTFQRQQAAAQQPPQPDPAQMQMQAEMQMRQVEMQNKTQLDASKIQIEQVKLQLEAEKTAKELELKQQDIMVNLERARKEAEIKIYELQATNALKVEEARNNIAMEAMRMSNTPQNEDTTETIKSVAGKQAPAAQQPIALHVNINQAKKKATFGYDAAGNRTAIVEDAEDAALPEMGVE